MKRRRFTPKRCDPDLLLPDGGPTEAGPEDPDAERIERLREMMEPPAAPRLHISTSRRAVAQARSNKAKPADYGVIGSEVGKLYGSLDALRGDEARGPVLKRIKELDDQYLAARATHPIEEQPTGLPYIRVWHGRVYGVAPKGLAVGQFLSILNHMLPPDHDGSEIEVRNRFLAFLWHIRRSATITVGAPISLGKPKSRCTDCGDVHPVSKRSKDLKLLGCPKCGSMRHGMIPPDATRPGSVREIQITQKDLCRRFRVTRSHLKTIVKRYSPGPRPGGSPRTAVTAQPLVPQRDTPRS